MSNDWMFKNNGWISLRELPKNEFFKRKENSKKVYKKEFFNRDIKKWTCSDYENVGNDLFLKSDTKVFVNFTY